MSKEFEPLESGSEELLGVLECVLTAFFKQAKKKEEREVVTPMGLEPMFPA